MRGGQCVNSLIVGITVKTSSPVMDLATLPQVSEDTLTGQSSLTRKSEALGAGSRKTGDNLKGDWSASC